jgi:hypothetical protein
MTAVYEAGDIKRKRSTKAEMEERYDALVDIVSDAAPTGVRFCYYRAVSQGIVPKTQNGYVMVQRALMHLREIGVIPWTYIVDSSRWMRKPETWSSADELLFDVARTYRRSNWDDSDTRVEVWCESESVAGVIWPVTSQWDVPLYPMKGQTSASFAYAAAMQYRNDDRPVIIYYVGDRDPAGLEIEANLADKLCKYSGRVDMIINRLACTAEQVTELELIGGKPKKRTWNHPTYGEQPFIGEAVEVEAIDAPILRELVADAVTSHLDQQALARTRAIEEQERELLLRMANGWTS